MTSTIDPKRFQEFLKLSSVITDFSEFQLRGTGQAELYYTTTTEIVGEGVMGELLEAFQTVDKEAESNPKHVDNKMRIFIFSDEKLGPIARNLMKLWYIGKWYELPGSWHERFGVGGKDRTFVPSPQSYVEGLLWTAIGAHPPGAKAPGYGTWTEPPLIPEADRLLRSA